MDDVRFINANALVALDVLLDVGSVTEAAKRLGVTQSAMSNTLARLRTQFSDPLLVREGRGLVPTALACRIRGPLKRSIEGLRGVLHAPESFDPARSTERIRLKANDYALSVLLGPLLRLLRARAPGIRAEFIGAEHYEDFDGLAVGTADAYVGFCDTIPAGHLAEPLLDEHLVCLARRDHPIIGRRLTLKRYVQCEHLVVSSSPGSATLIDSAVEAQGLCRKVALTVPYFLLVAPIVAEGDLVAATNSRTAEAVADRFGLAVHPLPFPLPTATLSLVWHARTQGDRAHDWFRSQLREVSNVV